MNHGRLKTRSNPQAAICRSKWASDMGPSTSEFAEMTKRDLLSHSSNSIGDTPTRAIRVSNSVGKTGVERISGQL